MNVGITGGSGFLGRFLTQKLVERGDTVVVFSRRRRETTPGSPVLWKTWDPVSGPISADLLDGLDAVVSLAGETAKGLWTKTKKRRMWESRVLGTRHLVQGWQESKSPPGVLLSCSASGYYGDGGDNELTESSPPGKGFLAGMSVEWEQESRKAETLDARVVQLRTTLPLHPAGGVLGALLPAFKLGLGATLGSGNQWFPWIHIEDWLRLMLVALDDDSLHGPLNLTAPNPVTNRTFTRTLAATLNRPAFLRAPAGFLRLLVREAADEMALVSQRAVPAKALALGFSFSYPDLEDALRHLLDS